MEPFKRIPKTENSKNVEEGIADGACDRDREDPSPDQPSHETPFDGVEALRRTNAHNGGGDDVRGGKGNSKHTGGLDDGGASGLGSEAVDWLKTSESSADGFDHALATAGNTEGDGSGAKKFYPEGNVKSSET